jgi:hypothetical protein
VTDVSLLIGLGGFFASSILDQLGRSALLPLRDPRIHESIAFENV